MQATAQVPASSSAEQQLAFKNALELEGNDICENLHRGHHECKLKVVMVVVPENHLNGEYRITHQFAPHNDALIDKVMLAAIRLYKDHFGPEFELEYSSETG